MVFVGDGIRPEAGEWVGTSPETVEGGAHARTGVCVVGGAEGAGLVSGAGGGGGGLCPRLGCGGRLHMTWMKMGGGIGGFVFFGNSYHVGLADGMGTSTAGSG